jgi:FKBP-type peptidyl-prolyl cis-trans isomerase
MRLLRAGILGGFFSLAISGCGEPGAIGPVAAPGANIPRPSPDAEPAAAVGEAGAIPETPKPSEAKAAQYKPALPTAKGETKTTPGGVTYETLKEGSGAELKFGQQAVVHYVGKLQNGREFDSSRENNRPMTVRIGVDKLIEGWVEAIPGMKVGEIRKLAIPPELGYKSAGFPPKIPPNATLVFEVELVEIIPDI